MGLFSLVGGVTSIEKHALDRWMYRMNGMDYGPFSTKDILDLVSSHKIDEQTDLRNHRSRKWEPLGHIPAFREFIDDLRRAERERKRQQQMEDSVMRVQRTLSKSRRVPYILLLIAAVSIGAVSYWVLVPEEPTGSGLSFDVFRDLSFKRLPLVHRTIASPSPKPRRKRASRKRSARTQNGEAAVQGMKAVAAVLPPVPEVDLSFDAKDVSKGRELTREDLDSIQKKATPRLIRCFRIEAGNEPDFKGGVVTLYILTSGRVALTRLETRPPPSRVLMDCTQAAVNGIRVSPFKGANQVMRLPLHVANVR
ncbi:MAG: DUF4339 domain-containing protein [Deltaproteobacteria bacterium]|nr:DUF4339 domain-containing protein [Deltaproteobacteria bacterium]